MAVSKTKIVYVQQSTDGWFFSDSDWDGDCFTKDPVHAEQRNTPWYEQKCICKRIEVTTITFKQHAFTPPKEVLIHSMKGPKVRYKCYCRFCGLSTKNYATPEMAKLRSQQILDPCQVFKWRFLDE